MSRTPAPWLETLRLELREFVPSDHSPISSASTPIRA